MLVTARKNRGILISGAAVVLIFVLFQNCGVSPDQYAPSGLNDGSMDENLNLNTPTPLTFFPATATLGPSATQAFTAFGGSNSYTFTLNGPGSIQSIVGNTATYRAPNTIPQNQTASLAVQDSAGSIRTVSITLQVAQATPTTTPTSTPTTTPTATPNASLFRNLLTPYGNCLISNNGKLEIKNPCTPYGSQSEQFELRAILIDQTWVFQLRSSAGSCATVKDSRLDNGAPIEMVACNQQNANQLWAQTNQNGYLRLQAIHSGKCLDVPHGNQGNTTQLIQYDCHADNDGRRWAQRFLRVRPAPALNQIAPATELRIRHIAGRCVRTAIGQGQDSPNLWSYSCGAGSQYRFRLISFAGNGAPYQIKSGNDKCLTVLDGATQNGTRITEQDCGTGYVVEQLWNIQPTPNAGLFFTIQRVGANLCMDLSGADDLFEPVAQDNGTAIQQWGCNGSNAQKFMFDLP